eukprot:15433841-Alexandrium_andersonii.AAC.1
MSPLLFARGPRGVASRPNRSTPSALRGPGLASVGTGPPGPAAIASPMSPASGITKSSSESNLSKL